MKMEVSDCTPGVKERGRAMLYFAKNFLLIIVALKAHEQRRGPMEWIVFTSAFAASFVECVEAFTIVLVVGMTINWRSALVGTGAALLILAVLVGVFGVALVQWVPLDVLRLVVGAILILFGLKWLKKAILRYAGLKALHDEEAIYEHELAEIRARGELPSRNLNGFGVALALKSVLLEGLEVAFIVITFGVSAARTEAARRRADICRVGRARRCGGRDCPRCAGPCAAAPGARKYAEVHRRPDADDLRHVLGR